VFLIEKIVKYRFLRFKSQNSTFQRVSGNLKWLEIRQLEDKLFALFFFQNKKRQTTCCPLPMKKRKKKLGVWV